MNLGVEAFPLPEIAAPVSEYGFTLNGFTMNGTRLRSQ